jgi:hypothetical protein
VWLKGRSKHVLFHAFQVAATSKKDFDDEDWPFV